MLIGGLVIYNALAKLVYNYNNKSVWYLQFLIGGLEHEFYDFP